MATGPFRATLLASILVSGTLLAGCAGAPGKNLLRNPGFEDGTAGWFWLESHATSDWGPFHVVGDRAHSGNRSAESPLSSKGRGPTLVIGIVQNLTLEATGGRLPRHITGSYFVDRWNTTIGKTYLQTVVSLFPAAGATQPMCPGLPQPSYPCQIAFPLGGLDHIPFGIVNRKFVFIDTATPTVGKWTSFDVPLRDDFVTAWGSEPIGVHHAWIYFELRYERADTDPPGAAADALVHWDDLGLMT